jgi:hypothetical protein
MARIEYCKAVLRPEGIACTLPAGHGKLDGGWDHANRPPTWSAGPKHLIGKPLFQFLTDEERNIIYPTWEWNDPAGTLYPTDENTESLR